MAIRLDAISERNLQGVHPDLVAIVRRAASYSDMQFRVIEGLRTLERQKKLVAIGASKTLNSRHLTGHAVDIVPIVDRDKDGDVDAKDMFHWPLYHKLAPTIKRAASDLKIPIEWGGDWRTFRDGPHWQLPFRSYPKK